jgi:transposase
MASDHRPWTRQGEAFWRAHHEAWKRSDLNQRQYCEAEEIPLKAFGNWRAQFKAEPQPPERKLLYRRRPLSPPLSPPVSPPLSPPFSQVIYPSSPLAGPIVPRPREGHRRRFSDADKQRILEGAALPGTSAAQVARPTASLSAFCVDGSRSWRWPHRRSSRWRSPMRSRLSRRSTRHDGIASPNVKVHLALGYIDMRKGIDGLAMLVQGVLRQDPFSGHLFVFRGRTRANLIKVVFWDGTGLCLFTKRLEHGVFLWPPSIAPGETLSLTSAQLTLLLDGVDWRAPEQRWRPAVAG